MDDGVYGSNKSEKPDNQGDGVSPSKPVIPNPKTRHPGGQNPSISTLKPDTQGDGGTAEQQEQQQQHGIAADDERSDLKKTLERHGLESAEYLLGTLAVSDQRSDTPVPRSLTRDSRDAVLLEGLIRVPVILSPWTLHWPACRTIAAQTLVAGFEVSLMFGPFASLVVVVIRSLPTNSSARSLARLERLSTD